MGIYHCSGTLMVGGSEQSAFTGPAYEPGDRIGVSLRKSAKAWQIAFSVNGKEVGTTPVGSGAELVVAVQPYMGGVALLL